MNEKYNMKHAKKSAVNWKIAMIVTGSIAVLALAFVIYLYFPIIFRFIDDKVLNMFQDKPETEITQEVASEETDPINGASNEEAEEVAEEEPDPEDLGDTEPEEDIEVDEESSENGEENMELGTAPTISLRIIEGPLYSSSDDICYYRVTADVTGDPSPSIVFSKDDSLGSLGYGKAQVNITRESRSYTLNATAENTIGKSSNSITLSWNCNRAPDISGISLATDTPYISESYDIRVNAEDLDGDDLTYSWSTNGGSFGNGTINPTVWNTPATPGDYTISVSVTDKIGNSSETSVIIYVGEPEPEPENINLPRKENEGGYIEYGGGTFTGGSIFAGDSTNNLPCSGFISFDISGIGGRTVNTATLTFSGASASGDPLGAFDSLWINSLDWGAEQITQDDFLLAGIAIASYKSPEITCNVSKLREELQKAINGGKSRFQIRIHFGGAYSDNDGQGDGWSYPQGNINLNVSLN